jgi:hypothetical protein
MVVPGGLGVSYERGTPGRRRRGDARPPPSLGTTPESSKQSPKVNFLLKAVVFKSQKRGYLRVWMSFTPPTLWRGCSSLVRTRLSHPRMKRGEVQGVGKRVWG